MTYGQTLKVPNGTVSIEGEDRNTVVQRVVDWAVSEGAKPRLHWWQFWQDEWPDDCIAEYKRITPNT